MKEEIGVIGFGNWGTALSQHLGSSGYKVKAWTNSEIIKEKVNSDKTHPECLKDIKLSNNILVTTNLEEATANKIILITLPSHALRVIEENLKLFNLNQVIISCVKGLESQNSLTPLQYFKQLGIKEENLCVISGPSFAHDVAELKPCGIVAASKNSELATKIAKLFSNSSMRVYPSNDPLGVELGGILKNVIALAAGISDGLNLGDSARAGLVTRGLSEMRRLIIKLGGKDNTIFGLSGLGDLSMTATSDLSRNRQVGLRLGKGEKLNDITRQLGSVAEAVKVTPHVLKLASSVGIEMPISSAVNKVLRGEREAKEMARELIERPLREGEF